MLALVNWAVDGRATLMPEGANLIQKTKKYRELRHTIRCLKSKQIAVQPDALETKSLFKAMAAMPVCQKLFIYRGRGVNLMITAGNNAGISLMRRPMNR